MNQTDIFTESSPEEAMLGRALRKHRSAMLTAAGGAVLFLTGLTVFLGSAKKSTMVISEPVASGSAEGLTVENDSPVRGRIQADVGGAVIKPGVYVLPAESRVNDALTAAGGLSAGADREWFAQNINRAAKLTDGAKLYIRRQGEALVRRQGEALGNGTAGQTAGALSGLININSAGLPELDSLPGVGPVTAQKIINGRPYGAIEELISKKAVSRSVFEKIKEKIAVY